MDVFHPAITRCRAYSRMRILRFTQSRHSENAQHNLAEHDIIHGVVYIPVLSTLQRLLESERVTSEVATSENTSHFVLPHDVFTYFHFRSKETTKVEILTFLQTFVMAMHSNPTPPLFSVHSRALKVCSSTYIFESRDECSPGLPRLSPVFCSRVL